MGKVFRSLGIIAGLSGMTGTTQALQVVDWSEQPPGTHSRPPSPTAATALLSPQVVSMGGGLASPRPSWSEGATAPLLSVPASLAPGTSSVLTVERQTNNDGGSPLLAGLPAVALLMWRRLRRH